MMAADALAKVGDPTPVKIAIGIQADVGQALGDHAIRAS